MSHRLTVRQVDWGETIAIIWREEKSREDGKSFGCLKQPRDKTCSFATDWNEMRSSPTNQPATTWWSSISFVFAKNAISQCTANLIRNLNTCQGSTAFFSSASPLRNCEMRSVVPGWKTRCSREQWIEWKEIFESSNLDVVWENSITLMMHSSKSEQYCW